MDSKSLRTVLVCLIAFYVLMPGEGLARSQGMDRILSTPLDYPEIDEDTVEQLWINCRLDLRDIEVVKNLLMEGMTGDPNEVLVKTTLSKANIQKSITFLPPQTKRILLDCLSRKNFPHRVSGKEYAPRKWYSEYFEFLFGWHSTSRRHLADFQSFQTAPASAPTVILASAPAPGNEVEPPNYSPAPAPHLAPTSPPSPPSPDGPSGAETPRQIIPPESHHSDLNTPPNSAPFAPLDKENDNKKSIVLAVILSSLGSFSFAAFLFFCYHKCCRKKSYQGNGPRDESPLLTLSRSDFSGSSHKSFGLQNSAKDKFGSLSFKIEPSQNGHVSSVDVSSVEAPSSLVSSRIANSMVETSAATVNIPAPKPPPPPPVMPPPIKKVAPPPGPPPPPPNIKPGPPPPPSKGAFPPRPPNFGKASSPLGPNHSGNTVPGQESSLHAHMNAPKAKLKPFFWDKVLANPDQSMVWHEISSGSFQFNEEMIESLFGYASADKRRIDGKKESSSNDPSTQYVQILDSKKSQNLAILLKALNVTTEEVSDALMEGNELPTDLLRTLLKMAPTTDEELKLRLYSGDLSRLGPAERFLKVMVDIPFAFKRMDTLLFMGSLQEDVSSLRETFATLEVACKELRSSRLFLKLLEAVLKTGNRMNDGTYRGGAQAFKLDTLLKLADVKGTDGKTTLLHFVVQETIRSEGVRAARVARESGSISNLTISSTNSEDLLDDSPRESGNHYRSLGLKIVSGLGNELENVKKAAIVDFDALTSMVANIGRGLVKAKEFLNTDMRSMEEESGFHNSLKSFVEHAEVDITSVLEEEKRTRSLVKNTTNYFHGSAGKDEGLWLFVVVRDFLGMVGKACKEVKEAPKKVRKAPVNRDAPAMLSMSDNRKMLFPAIRDRRVDNSSSDDEG